jgi:putative NIF3 family GTP cyclohydrolase 1 type 2
MFRDYPELSIMKLEEIYQLAVKVGMDADPRTKEEIEAELKRVEDKFKKMEEKEKKWFDMDSLWNPYSDTRILVGDPKIEINGIMWGIDVTPAEILIADRLRERGEKIDLIIGHHPRGRAMANFYDVMHVQEIMLQRLGVPITVAEDILAPRIKEVQRGVHPQNFNQTVDACNLLGIPFMCIHSPTDNLVQKYLQTIMDEKRPERVKDVVDILCEIPEFDFAMKHHAGPEIFVGDKNRRAGKIAVKMTGGTSGPKEMYEQLVQAGVGTVVCMHAPENHIDEAKKYHINLVISGHMASDSLGMNLLADELEERGLSIKPFSGYIRVKRN